MANNETSIIISAVDKTESALNAIKGNVGQLGNEFSKLQGIAAGFAGLAGAGLFASMIKGSVESMAALQQLSERTGATVEGLSAMRSAAKASGTDMEQVGGALQRLSKNMTTLDDDGKTASRALASIGLESEKIRNLKPDAAMLEIAKALGDVQDGADKTAVAMALFGKSGANVLPFMKDLAELGALNAKVTAEQAAQADAFEKNLVKLGASGQGWQKELTAGMLPAMLSFSEAALEVINGAGGIRDEVRKLAEDGSLAEWAKESINGLTYVMQVGESVARVLEVMGTRLGGMAAAAAAAMSGNFSGAGAIVEQMNKDTEALWSKDLISTKLREAFAKTIAAKSQAIADYQAAVVQVQQAYANADVSVQQAAQKALRDSFFGAEKRELNFKATLDTSKAKESADELGKVLNKIYSEASGVDSSYWKDLDTLHKAYAAGRLTLEKYADAVAKLTNEQKFAKDLRKADADALKEFSKLAEEAAKAQEKELETLEKKATTLTEQADNYGKSESAIYAATKAQLANRLEVAASIDGNEAEVESLKRKIAAYEKLADAAGRIETDKANEAAAKKAVAEWEKAADQISQSLTDAIMGGGQTAGELLKNYFKTLVLRPIIQATVNGIIGGSPATSGSTIGTANSLSNLYGNASSLYSLGSQWIGGSMSTANAAGTLYANATGTGIDGLLATNGAYGTATGAGAGAGAAASAWLPVIGWFAAAYSFLDWFSGLGGGAKSEAQAFGQIQNGTLGSLASMQNYTGETVTDRTAPDPASYTYWGTLNADTYGDARNQYNYLLGNDSQLNAALTKIVSGAADFVKKLGGTADGIQTWLAYATDPQGTAPDNVGVTVRDASGGLVYGRTYDAARGSSAETIAAEANRILLATIEAASGIPQVFKDVVSSLDLASASASDLTAAIGKISAIGTLRDTFDALGLGAEHVTTALITAAGGTDALGTAINKYYENFYTADQKAAVQAAQAAKTTDALTKAFSDIGFALPTTREGFKSIADQLLAMGPAGESALAKLLGMQDAFLAITPAAGDATSAVSAMSDAFKSSAQSIFDTIAKLNGSYSDSNTALTKLGAINPAWGSIANLQTISTADLQAIANNPKLGQTVVDLINSALQWTLAHQLTFTSSSLGTMGPDQATTSSSTGTVATVLDTSGAVTTTVDNAAAILNQRLALQAELYKLTGDAAGAAAVLEQQHAIALAALDPSLRDLQKQLWSAQAAASDAAAAQKLANDKLALQAQIAELSGNAALAASVKEQQHAIALAALDPALRDLQNNLWGLQDAAQAAAQATAAQSALDAATKTVASQYQAFVSAVSTAQSAVDSARDRITEGYLSAVDAVASAEAQISSLQQQAAQDLLDLAKSLREFVGSIDRGDMAGTSTAQRFAAAQSDWAVAVAQARAGDKTALGKLTALSGDLLSLGKDSTKTQADYLVLVANVKNTLGDLSGAIESQNKVTAATQSEQERAQAELLRAQNEVAKWIKAAAESGAATTRQTTDYAADWRLANEKYLTALGDKNIADAMVAGLNLTLKTPLQELADAIVAMSNAIAALGAVKQTTATPSSSPLNLVNDGIKVPVTARQDAIQTLYETMLGRVADNAGMAYWDQSGQSLAEIAANIALSAEYKRLNGYASGGYYGGGLALVGERGPELINFANPGQVYTADQTAALFGGGGNGALLAELRAARVSNEEMRAILRDIAASSRKSKDTLVRVTRDGQTMVTTTE